MGGRVHSGEGHSLCSGKVWTEVLPCRFVTLDFNFLRGKSKSSNNSLVWSKELNDKTNTKSLASEA